MEDNGDALNRVFPELYDELKSRAHRAFRSEPPDHTLRPTELVHEVYVRLRHQRRVPEDRETFLGVAAVMMRRVLIDHARQRKTRRRNDRVTLDEKLVGEAPTEVSVEQLAVALGALQCKDAKAHAVVIRRYLSAMSNAEIARDLGWSERSVRRFARLGRAILNQLLGADG